VCGDKLTLKQALTWRQAGHLTQVGRDGIVEAVRYTTADSAPVRLCTLRFANWRGMCKAIEKGKATL
jgi:hypothetical protein